MEIDPFTSPQLILESLCVQAEGKQTHFEVCLLLPRRHFGFFEFSPGLTSLFHHHSACCPQSTQLGAIRTARTENCGGNAAETNSSAFSDSFCGWTKGCQHTGSIDISTGEIWIKKRKLPVTLLLLLLLLLPVLILLVWSLSLWLYHIITGFHYDYDYHTCYYYFYYYNYQCYALLCFALNGRETFSSKISTAIPGNPRGLGTRRSWWGHTSLSRAMSVSPNPSQETRIVTEPSSKISQGFLPQQDKISQALLRWQLRTPASLRWPQWSHLLLKWQTNAVIRSI